VSICFLWANGIKRIKNGLREDSPRQIWSEKRGRRGQLTIQDLFIANLKGYRKLRKISQMRLAELCNSSTGYIGEIESGKRFPSVNMIERIAQALKIESYSLFKNEPIEPSASNFSTEDLTPKLAPSQKKVILNKINSALLKVLDDF
jgi:transcriptional regulator with XRE-family HTH domain